MWLLPRVVDGEVPVRPRMKDARYGEPGVAELRGTLPHEPTPLAASLERAPPQVGHTEPERGQRPDVRWDRIVSEVASDDLPQPFPLFGDRPVHPALQLQLDVLKFRPHAVAPGLPLKQEAPLARCSANEREPQEREGFRFTESAFPAIGRREATKLNQAGLVRMERQHERLKSRAHRNEEATSIVLVFEADDQIVGIPHDDHIAGGLTPSPACGP